MPTTPEFSYVPLVTRSQLSYGMCHDNVIRDEEERIKKKQKQQRRKTKDMKRRQTKDEKKKAQPP